VSFFAEFILSGERFFAEPVLSYKILRGVYPERCIEILRYAQNDKMRRAQNDRMRRAQNDRMSTLNVEQPVKRKEVGWLYVKLVFTFGILEIL